MIFNEETAVIQINGLLHNYNGLRISEKDETHFSLTGSVLINRQANGYWLNKEYQVTIVIPLASDDLPYVLDSGNHIKKDFIHRYKDGRLCLETDTSIRVRYIDGFSLETWMTDYVEPYYFSYEYYQRFNTFPFGERGHGILGVIQTYSDLFEETDDTKVIRLLKAIVAHQYRGHSTCPCGSSLRLRSCHGSRVMRFYTDSRLRAIVQNDLIWLQKEATK